jgi:general secretion pathway protein G
MKKGFTLLEVLVAIAIIIIITGFSLVSLESSRKGSRDTRRKADLEQLRSALEMYRADVGQYPSSIDFANGIINGTDTYLAGPIADPLSTNHYYYLRDGTNPNLYKLCSTLELGSQTGCDALGNDCGAAVCRYMITSP